jgi:hypothetical protein
MEMSELSAEEKSPHMTAEPVAVSTTVLSDIRKIFPKEWIESAIENKVIEVIKDVKNV